MIFKVSHKDKNLKYLNSYQQLLLIYIYTNIYKCNYT